jgi:hypothetical protein
MKTITSITVYTHLVKIYCLEARKGSPKLETFSEQINRLCSSVSSKSQTQRPCGVRRGSATASLLELQVRIPLTVWILVGRSLCNELTTCSDEPYRVCVCVCVCVCDYVLSRNLDNETV